MEVPEEVAGESVAESGPRRRRRGRTVALIGAAAVLGLVAGTCAGYLVQVDRAPTELPSLSQPSLAQATGDGPEPLSAARDRRVKTDGDLRKLLLRKPRGARDAEYLMGDEGWLDLAGYAEYYKKPGEMFGKLVSDEFRRAAVTGWRVDGTYQVEIRLLQFRQEEVLAAADRAGNSQYWAEAEGGTDSWAVPGTGEGRAYVHNRPETEPGYVPVYNAEAHAWRGDIAVEIWVTDTKPIPKAKIMGLAERQMERL
ncbi:hypothetical protein PV963_21255 [Streptomyces coeruleorubidus]|uniref:hypothetical protein n=1 Tax=Streptomyces coeruleorubidus TaxID=116188 RepID=UPI00237FC4B1|nr:hypothetical protein [Streptomyces coeruleorubidus]WDV52724.1 hypothetical protein PV963_21255 [Streptomyces coeruleorubidus]